MNNRGWTEKTLLAAIRFLGDSRVKADHRCHRHDACRVLGNMLTNDAADLDVRVVSV